MKMGLEGAGRRVPKLSEAPSSFHPTPARPPEGVFLSSIQMELQRGELHRAENRDPLSQPQKQPLLLLLLSLGLCSLFLG